MGTDASHVGVRKVPEYVEALDLESIPPDRKESDLRELPDGPDHWDV